MSKPKLFIHEGTAVFEDLYDYMKSLELILSLNLSVIYPGHDDVIDDHVEKIQYYNNHRNERTRQILEAIVASQKPLTTMEIVKIVFTTTPRHLYPAAAVNVNQHLIKLKKKEKLSTLKMERKRNGSRSLVKTSQNNKL